MSCSGLWEGLRKSCPVALFGLVITTTPRFGDFLVWPAVWLSRRTTEHRDPRFLVAASTVKRQLCAFRTFAKARPPATKRINMGATSLADSMDFRSRPQRNDDLTCPKQMRVHRITCLVGEQRQSCLSQALVPGSGARSEWPAHRNGVTTSLAEATLHDLIGRSIVLLAASVQMLGLLT
jgi:hypothetical protein